MKTINAQTIINEVMAAHAIAPAKRTLETAKTPVVVYPGKINEKTIIELRHLPGDYLTIQTSARGTQKVLNCKEHLQKFADMVRKNASAFGGGIIRTIKPRAAVSWPANMISLFKQSIEDKDYQAALDVGDKLGALFFIGYQNVAMMQVAPVPCEFEPRVSSVCNENGTFSVIEPGSMLALLGASVLNKKTRAGQIDNVLLDLKHKESFVLSTALDKITAKTDQATARAQWITEHGLTSEAIEARIEAHEAEASEAMESAPTESLGDRFEAELAKRKAAREAMAAQDVAQVVAQAMADIAISEAMAPAAEPELCEAVAELATCGAGENAAHAQSVGSVSASNAPTAINSIAKHAPTFYSKGDEARYTGKTQEISGAIFYEFEYLEGASVGKLGVTQRAPDGVNPGQAKPTKSSGIITPQVPAPSQPIPPVAALTPTVAVTEYPPAAIEKRGLTDFWVSGVGGWDSVGGQKNAPGYASEASAKIAISKNKWKSRNAVIVPFRYSDGGLHGCSPYADARTRFAVLVHSEDAAPEVEIVPVVEVEVMTPAVESQPAAPVMETPDTLESFEAGDGVSDALFDAVKNATAAQVQALTDTQFSKLYDHLENWNFHTENYMLEALRLGDASIIDDMRQIVIDQSADGCLRGDVYERRIVIADRMQAIKADQDAPQADQASEVAEPVQDAPQAQPRPTVRSKSGIWNAWLYVNGLGLFGLEFIGSDGLIETTSHDTNRERMQTLTDLGRAADSLPPNPPEKTEGWEGSPVQNSNTEGFKMAGPVRVDLAALIVQGVKPESLIGLGVYFSGDMANPSGSGAITGFSHCDFYGLVVDVTLESGYAWRSIRTCVFKDGWFSLDGKMHGAPYLAQLSATVATLKASASSAAEQATKAHATALIDLVAQFPQLKQAENNYSGGKLAAANIRILLKEAFKGQKFSVTSDYSKVDVRWDDGPTDSEVNAVIGRFDIGASDTQSDYFYAVSTAFSQLFGGVQYLHTRRTESDKLVQMAINQAFPDAADKPTVSDWRKGTNDMGWGDWKRRWVSEALNTISLFSATKSRAKA